MAVSSTLDHVAEFDRAWSDPRNTAIELPAVDVNRVLRDSYELDRELTYTRDMLWDMEVRKASAPDFFIPSVVEPGSAHKWASAPNEFTRSSRQRLWLAPAEFELIIEHVRVVPTKQSVYFIGAPEFRTPEGALLRAGTGQPLFHVEHWVDGTQDQPLNRWRIVHLTESPDPAMIEQFARMVDNRYLRDFIEVHIREVLGYTLVRKG